MTDWLKIELQLRADCYAARRILRTDNPATKRRIMRGLSSSQVLNVTELAEVLPPLLATHCIAEAEALAVEKVLTQRGKTA